MLVTPQGAPIPSERSLKILREINPRLSLRWVDGAVSYWAITERWRDDDPRRERIKQNEIPADMDWDIKNFLPRSCSPEEVEGFILRFYVRVEDPEKQAREAIDQTARENKAARDKAMNGFLQEQEDQTIRTTKHQLEVQMGEATANAQIVVPATIGKGKKK